jgi:hypothetical protein
VRVHGVRVEGQAKGLPKGLPLCPNNLTSTAAHGRHAKPKAVGALPKFMTFQSGMQRPI